MPSATTSPPRAPILYKSRMGTRWQKEKEAAGEKALEFPDDPKSIGPWIIGECVGKGASGHVKIAKHRRTGKLAAVKILPLQPIFNSRSSLATQKARTDKQRLGIDREITMMKLMNHPNIMRIYDVYEGEKELYLILEYIEGGELFDFLVNRGKLSPLEALAYFKQIVYGLNYAHSFSIIHRDLKPENILIHSLHPPLVKLADWGMAAFAPPAWHLETSCGSPHYASPEIVNGHKYQGTATDIWSCGVILFALLTGRLPFDDKNVKTLLGKVKLGKYEIPSFVDPQAKDLIARMLVLDVNDRISMVDILAHPWMKIATPSILYVPAPSVEELARPLPSKDHIDRDLFESLCVIWGRHVDFNSIKDDLLSPPGQGTLAKAFYFLLQKHREKTMEEHGIVMDVDESGGDKVTLKHYIAPRPRESLKLDLDGSSALSRQTANGSRYSNSTVVVSSTDSPSSSRFHPPTPVGPRAQKSRPLSSPVPPRKDTQATQLRSRQTMKANDLTAAQGDLPYHVAHVRRPAQSGFRYTAPAPMEYMSASPHPSLHPTACVAVPGSIRAPSNVSMIRGSTAPAYTNPSSPVTRTSVQLEGNLSRPPIARASTAPYNHAYPAYYPPDPARTVHAPIPLHPYSSAILPMITAPRVESSDVQRTIDDIADRMNLLVAHENAHYAQGPSPRPHTPSTPTTPTTPTLGHGERSKGSDRFATDNDKENQASWWKPTPRSPGTRQFGGLGFSGSELLNKEPTNVVYIKAPIATDQPKEKKERKGRPPALDFHSSANRQNIPSPLLSSPLSTPSGGEFKGWFSNLFNWRAQSYVLYSFESLSYTRDEMTRLLHQCGITIMAAEPPLGSVIKCRLEDVHDEASGVVLQKRVCFRVEFSTIGSGNLSSPSRQTGTPKLPMSPILNTSAFPSAVVLILEKGAVSTFKSAYFRLRESWRLDSASSREVEDVTMRSSVGFSL